MGIEITGLRVGTLHIDPRKEGKDKLTGSYELLSGKGRVLAKQDFNTYDNIEVVLSIETAKAFNDFLGGLEKDIGLVIGIEG